MIVNFLQDECQFYTNEKIFGIRDENNKQPAFHDEDKKNKKVWIAVVVNKQKYDVTFTAIDHCMEFPKVDGLEVERCDAALFYNHTTIFIELKESVTQRRWLTKGDQQLRNTIMYFDATDEAKNFPTKLAYIANRLQPNINRLHFIRTEKFFDETKYVLRIQNTIVLK